MNFGKNFVPSENGPLILGFLQKQFDSDEFHCTSRHDGPYGTHTTTPNVTIVTTSGHRPERSDQNQDYFNDSD